MLYRLDKINNIASVMHVPECSAYEYYKSINMQPIDLVPRQDQLLVGACMVDPVECNCQVQSENIVLGCASKKLTSINEEPQV